MITSPPSSYRLRFTPDFGRQKREWLAQSSVPDGELPEIVEHALASIQGVSAGSPVFPLGKRALWRAVLDSVRSLLIRSAALSVLSAVFASCATLAAMRILTDGRLGAKVALAGLYFALSCLNQGVSFRAGRLRGWVGLASQAFLVGLISRKLLGLSSRAAAGQTSGNLKVLVTSDVQNVGQFLENVVRNLIPSVAAIVVTTPFLIHLSGIPGLIGILVMASLLPVALGLNVVSARFQDKGQAEMDRLASLAGEWVKNIRLIRYLSWEAAFGKDISERVRGYLTYSVAQHFMACLIFGLGVSWWMVSVTAVVLVARGELDLIGFFGSLWLITFTAGYFTHLPNTIRLYGLAAPSIDRIARLLAEENQADALREGDPLPPGARPRAVRFEGVSYAYPGGAEGSGAKTAIRGLSARIELGCKLAIIGEVGSGKSTFLRLLCGEMPPTEGRIVIEFEYEPGPGDDGRLPVAGARPLAVERDLWTRAAHEALRERVAYVPQEPFVSSDRFDVNIHLGQARGGSGERDVLEAAYWAELEADLAAFPDGVRQELGESGVNLSGGQRQRLNLARARYSGREWLVMDDTLSAVDTATEIRLVSRLAERSDGFVLVTHRTGELDRVERVLVMSEGAIVEEGSPSSLARDPDSQYTRVLRAYASSEAPHG